MTANDTAKITPSWRKANRNTVFRLAFLLILAGFAAGYAGGVQDCAPLIAAALTLWTGASVLALLARAKD